MNDLRHLLADLLRLIFAKWLCQTGELLRSLQTQKRKQP